MIAAGMVPGPRKLYKIFYIVVYCIKNRITLHLSNCTDLYDLGITDVGRRPNCIKRSRINVIFELALKTCGIL